MTELFIVEPDVLTKVLKQFNRNEKSLNEDVDVLKKWLQTQPHLPKTLECKMLRNFLILNKFSIEKTKQKIDMYYTVRSSLKDIYNQINPGLPNMKELKDIIYIVSHPKQAPDMSRLLFVKLRNKRLIHKLEPENAIRRVINFQEMRMREDVACADIVMIDCEGFAPSMYKITPTICYKAFVLIYERVFSFRLKALYLFNFPPVAEKILAFIKPIVKPKLFKRIHICSLTEVWKNFPADLLPTEFGGTEFSFQELQDLHESKLAENADLFAYLDTVRVDEKLRPEKLKDDEILGFYGNFKKLDID